MFVLFKLRENAIINQIAYMGNCIGENQTQSNRRWERPPPQRPPQHTRHHPMGQQPHNPNRIPSKVTNRVPEIESNVSDMLEIYSNEKTPGTYQSPEVKINQVLLYQRYHGQCSKNPKTTVYVKAPLNREQTSFLTVPQPLWIFPPPIGTMTVQQIRGGYFQQKMTWLRFQVQRLRVNWEHGSETIQVDRHNILMSSIQQLQKINLRKEIKIKFDNQEVDDAGGVLRQWMNLAVKEIFNFQMTGLFKMCNTEETAYRFVLDLDQSEDQIHFRLIVAKLLGMIIGKALFERISLNCFVTKSIWRQICNQQVKNGDFYFYDKQIYKNLNFIRDNTCSTDLGLNFTYLIPCDNRDPKTVTLKPKGESISVTDNNKYEFINLLINYMTSNTCKHYIKAIREGIEKVMPVSLLEPFEPFEMQMLLNGPQHINVQEWKSSTNYKNCSLKDKQVQWFWKYVQRLDQDHLGNLLHYVTGSKRVPILGFFYLESNRNQINRFTIEKVAYEKTNPYPKSHTCFNRLELPDYQSEHQLKERMDVIVSQEINSFGLS